MRRQPEILFHRGQTFISLDGYIDLLMERGDRTIAAYIVGDVIGRPNSWTDVDERIEMCRETAKRVREQDKLSDE